MLKLREVVCHKVLSFTPLSLIGRILVDPGDLPKKVDRCENACIKILLQLFIQTRPRVVDQNHHVDDFLVKVDSVFVMSYFVVKVENVLLDEFLLVLWDPCNVVGWRRVPPGQHVVFEC